MVSIPVDPRLEQLQMAGGGGPMPPMPAGPPMGAPGMAPMGGMPPVLEHGKMMLDALRQDPSPDNKMAFEAILMEGASILGIAAGGQGPAPAGPAMQGPPPPMMPQGQ